MSAHEILTCGACHGWGREVDPGPTGEPDESSLRPCHQCDGSGDADPSAVIGWLIEHRSELSPGAWSWDTEACDCGDGYGCSHGSYVNGINLRNRFFATRKPDATWPTGEFGIAEFQEMTDADLVLIAMAPRLLDALAGEPRDLPMTFASTTDEAVPAA